MTSPALVEDQPEWRLCPQHQCCTTWYRWCSRTHVHFNKERQAGIVPRDCVSCVLALSIVASALRPAVVMRGTAFDTR